jgi:hypothetical protein
LLFPRLSYTTILGMASQSRLLATRLRLAAGLGSYVKRDGAVPKGILLAAAKAACAELARDDDEEEQNEIEEEAGAAM